MTPMRISFQSRWLRASIAIVTHSLGWAFMLGGILPLLFDWPDDNGEIFEPPIPFHLFLLFIGLILIYLTYKILLTGKVRIGKKRNS